MNEWAKTELLRKLEEVKNFEQMMSLFEDLINSIQTVDDIEDELINRANSKLRMSGIR